MNARNASPAEPPSEVELPRVPSAELEEPEHLEADLLVEEVSIDGMCGVY